PGLGRGDRDEAPLTGRPGGDHLASDRERGDPFALEVPAPPLGVLPGLSVFAADGVRAGPGGAGGPRTARPEGGRPHPALAPDLVRIRSLPPSPALQFRGVCLLAGRDPRLRGGPCAASNRCRRGTDRWRR